MSETIKGIFATAFVLLFFLLDQKESKSQAKTIPAAQGNTPSRFGTSTRRFKNNM